MTAEEEVVALGTAFVTQVRMGDGVVPSDLADLSPALQSSSHLYTADEAECIREAAGDLADAVSAVFFAQPTG